jgi:molybdate transport system ATP-binding protein
MKLELDIHLERDGFSLDVEATLDGEAWGIFGPSGSGKTSLLDGIAGLTRIDRGRLVLDGETLVDRRAGHRRRETPIHKRGIGYVFQEPRLLPHLSVLANLRYAEKRTPRSRRRFVRDDIIDLLKLRPLLAKSVNLLSGGEQRRVAIGRALLTSPRLLLLDEPMTGLDAAHRCEILAYLRRISRELGVAMLIVSHDMRDILALTDKLLLLDGGRVVDTGAMSDLLSRPKHLPRLDAAGVTNVLELHCDAVTPDGLARLSPMHRPVCDTTGQPIHLLGPPWPGVRAGQRVTLALRPEDISLARGPVEYISVQNQLRGRVTRVSRCGDVIWCAVNVGVELLVEVTPLAAEQLDLVEGQRTWVFFKARAMEQLAVHNGTGPSPAPAPPGTEPSRQRLERSLRYVSSAAGNGPSARSKMPSE